MTWDYCYVGYYRAVELELELLGEGELALDEEKGNGRLNELDDGADGVVLLLDEVTRNETVGMDDAFDINC